MSLVRASLPGNNCLIYNYIFSVINLWSVSSSRDNPDDITVTSSGVIFHLLWKAPSGATEDVIRLFPQDDSYSRWRVNWFSCVKWTDWPFKSVVYRTLNSFDGFSMRAASEFDQTQRTIDKQVNFLSWVSMKELFESFCFCFLTVWDKNL